MIIEIAAAAERDLEALFAYFVNQVGLSTADRFLAATRQSLLDLSEMSGMGEPQEFRAPELANIRKWHVSGFRSFLIFYCVKSDCIRVIRILHGSRDTLSVVAVSLVEDARAEEDI